MLLVVEVSFRIPEPGSGTLENTPASVWIVIIIAKIRI